MEKRRAIFPGTFDPFTIGHQSLVDRALTLVDEIVISIGINSAKKTYFSLEERVASIEQLYRSDPRVKVMLYDSLTVDFAKRIDARFILRGIRTVNDFEYEKYMADVNREHISVPVSCASCYNMAKISPVLFLKKFNTH